MIVNRSVRLPDLERNRKVELLLLLTITLLAAVLRLYKLGEWSFWIDELSTIGRIQAHYSSLESTLRNVPPHTNWVPVSLLLSSLFLDSFGVSEWSARLGAALIGILSVPLLYFSIRTLFGNRVALIAALLLAVSPWHLMWSQNARFYTGLMLFYTLALFAIYFGLERDRPSYLLLALPLFYLAVSERLFAIFLIPVVIIYLLLVWLLPFEKPAGLNRRNLLILAAPLMIGLLIEGGSLFFTGDSRFFGDMGWFFGRQTYSALHLLTFFSFNVGTGLMSLALFGGAYLLLQRNRAGLLLLAAAIVPVLILGFLTVIMFTEERYAFVTLPAWIILAAVTVEAIRSRLQSYRFVLALAVVILLVAEATSDNLLYFRANEGNRQDWRAAFSLVQDQASKDDVVAAYWPEFAPYYLGGREIVSLSEVTVDDIVAQQRRTWFLIDAWGSPLKNAWIAQNARLVDVFYLRTPDDHSIRVYLYDPSHRLVTE